MEECLDITIPMPMEHERQTIAQRWYAKQMRIPKGASVTYGDWHLNGQAHIFFGFGKETRVDSRAQLRFGRNNIDKGGCNFCLVSSFNNDDKHEFDIKHMDCISQSIGGTVSTVYSVVFYVYPYQTSRLKRFCDDKWIQKKIEFKGYRAFLNTHIVNCKRLK